MIYIDTGINWVFPYHVVYEDDCIVILKELNRVHKRDIFLIDSPFAYPEFSTDMNSIKINGTVKLLEVVL